MGGGRDFLGNRLYRRVGGKYERIRPYKKDYDALIDRLRNEPLVRHEVREILHQFGFKDEQLGYIDQIKIIRERNDMSIGLAKMAMAYGTDMFDKMTVDGEGMENNTYAHAHLYGRPEINLNPLYFMDGKNHDYQYDIETGFHPKGMDNEMLIEHEYAHLLQRRLAGITRKEEIEFAKVNKEIETLEKQREELNAKLNEMIKKETRWGDQLQKLMSKRTYSEEDVDKARQLQRKIRKISEDWDKGHKEYIQVLNSLNSTNKKFDVISKKILDSAHPVIEQLFSKAGASSLVDVAVKLTGKESAYASKEWSEAHAECVADYMRNGKNASPISIAYVRKMNKYFKSVK